MSSAYLRRERLKRFLTHGENLRFVCRSKRKFNTREEAAECQPAQKPYRCKACRSWHLTAPR